MKINDTVTWVAELRGDSLDLEHLATQLTDSELNVMRHAQGYRLQCVRLNGIQDASLVAAEVERLLAVLNGLLQLLRFSKTPLVSASIHGVDATGSLCSTLIAAPISLVVSVDDGQIITIHDSA